MSVRFKAMPVADGRIRLVLPSGRHLQEGGWYVAADVHEEHAPLLVLRVWALPADNGFRVIAIDDGGGEYGSVRVPKYEHAQDSLGLNGRVRHTHARARRLVSGGDSRGR